VRTWRENPQQFATLIDTSYTEVGTFSEQITYEGEKVWLTILVLAQPETTKVVPTQKKVQQYTPAPEISDSDIVQALNLYRSDHQVHQLVVDNNLCTYAEKRVQDLIAFGGLDNHQGFKADFANNEQIPESIKAYSGGAIGENLASQYCINGTTNQKFTATTATALIEWCFDSSVKGHREAQLNTRYNAVCSRHGQNMYVIIFGE